MTPTAKGTLQLDQVLADTYARHKKWFDDNNVTGMNCEDPATAPAGRARKSFFLWVCNEYHVQNGRAIWLDLQPEDAPQWVRRVLSFVAADYTEDTELLVVASW